MPPKVNLRSVLVVVAVVITWTLVQPTAGMLVALQMGVSPQEAEKSAIPAMLSNQKESK